MRKYLAPFASTVPATTALAFVATSVLAVACDAPMRVGERGASEAVAADGGPQVFGADAGLDDLEEADASVDRTGGVMDAIAGVSVATLAGGRVAGRADGVGEAAQFHNPVNLAIEPGGSLVVTDFDNGLLRRVSSDGQVSTVVPAGVFALPVGLVFTPSGELFVETDIDPVGDCNEYTGSVWRVDPASGVATAIATDFSSGRIDTNGNVQTVAGDGAPGLRDGEGAGARVYGEEAIAVTPDGKVLYVADGTNGEGARPYHRVRKISIP